MRSARLLKYIMLLVMVGIIVVVITSGKWMNHMYFNTDESVFKFRSPSVDESSQTITDMVTTRSTFRDNFLLWNKARQNIAETIYPYSSDKASRYLIYRCDSGRLSHCGGLADRLKGMIAGYIIANITDRQFKAEILNPNCYLHQYIIPNLVNWSLSTSFHQSLDKIASDTKIVNLMNNKIIYNNIGNINFTELIGSSKYVYFRANLDYSQGFRHSHLHRDKLSWMEQVTPDQIQATIFKQLFSLSPRLQSRLQNLLAQELPTSKHKLVCAHVRMGKNPTLPTDYFTRLSSEHLPNVWKFIKHHSTSDFHKVFVMSDSAEVMNQSRLQEFGARLVLTPGVIGHVDIPANLNTEDMCSATEKVIFDLHLLMNCDVLMISDSGLSRLAAYVRGSDEGLYCLDKERVIPCKKINLKDIYQVLG
uniref:L-Fucosyltransferase n=1 Tax=Arion vulgaris TaxID=1028688 RepID=A0A0B7BA76_9EUPU